MLVQNIRLAARCARFAKQTFWTSQVGNTHGILRTLCRERGEQMDVPSVGGFHIGGVRPSRPASAPAPTQPVEDHAVAALEEFLAGWVSDASSKGPSLDSMIKLQQATTPELPVAQSKVQNSDDHDLRQIEMLVAGNRQLFAAQRPPSLTDGWNIAGLR